MYAASMKWRAEFGVDTILEDFHFHERDAFISLYPQGYHKTDKTVNALSCTCTMQFGGAITSLGAIPFLCPITCVTITDLAPGWKRILYSFILLW